MIQERQKTILDALIREHIRTSRPVSSKEIIQEYRFDFSPATVRNEMLELDRQGYLVQPHISSGRVPTDKGYRFFVDFLTCPEPLSSRDKKKVDGIFAKKKTLTFVEDLAGMTAEFSGLFSLAGLFEGDIFSWRGFSGVLNDPDFADAKNTRSLARLLDGLGGKIDFLTRDLEKKRQKVFIGHENPLEDSDCLSMMISSWEHPDGFGGFLTLVGSKRMDYQKNMSLLNYIQNF